MITRGVSSNALHPTHTRMVRRMLDACGHPVRALCRVRHGELRLGALASGEMREVSPSEKQYLKELLQVKYEV
jgi:23S rRNA pseudouridine2605 synthase